MAETDEIMSRKEEAERSIAKLEDRAEVTFSKQNRLKINEHNLKVRLYGTIIKYLMFMLSEPQKERKIMWG